MIVRAAMKSGGNLPAVEADFRSAGNAGEKADLKVRLYGTISVLRSTLPAGRP